MPGKDNDSRLEDTTAVSTRQYQRIHTSGTSLVEASANFKSRFHNKTAVGTRLLFVVIHDK